VITFDATPPGAAPIRMMPAASGPSNPERHADHREPRHLGHAREVGRTQRRAHAEHDDLDEDRHEPLERPPAPFAVQPRMGHRARDERQHPERERKRVEPS
jgi:hypothetical protein